MAGGLGVFGDCQNSRDTKFRAHSSVGPCRKNGILAGPALLLQAKQHRVLPVLTFVLFSSRARGSHKGEALFRRTRTNTEASNEKSGRRDRQSGSIDGGKKTSTESWCTAKPRLGMSRNTRPCSEEHKILHVISYRPLNVPRSS